MTHNETILAHLKAGLTLNDDEARTLFNCNRLGARIYELRLAGHNIGAHEEMNVGKPGTHARYFLMSDDAAPVGRQRQVVEQQPDLFEDGVPA